MSKSASVLRDLLIRSLAMSDSPLRIIPNKASEPARQEDSATEQTESQQEQLTELRRLVLEPEQVQIRNILERLNNPRVRAREVSRSLPEAIRLRASQDESLTEALSPTIVTAFHNSVKQDPRPVAEAISPLMGPAIRRAISTALNAMIQSLDQALKYSLSWQGVKWRLEAMRTGKSFAEVVLYHTLLYRVEQVFLIHKESGLLLQHVTSGTVSAQDADIVSGMLTAIREAIRNFARDSFGAGHDEHIEKLDLGDREVWFEPGPYAVLAVVIRGNAPESLRGDFFAPAIEAIHVEMRETLEAFDGDTKPFEIIRRHLKNCLQSRYQAHAEAGRLRLPAYIWLSLALILTALVTWSILNWREQQRWNDYIDKLKSTPGIVVIETGRRSGKHYVAGLRDPLSVQPDEILRQRTQLNPDSVISRWDRYQALDPQFVRERAVNLLKPPQGVTLNIDNGILVASGSAPYRWIAESRKLALAIPGVEGFDDQNLINEDFKEPETLRSKIEQRIILFKMGTTQVLPGQTQALQDLVSEIQRLITLAPSANRSVQIQVIGHTDAEGDEKANLRLSQERASHIFSLIVERGVDSEHITAVGIGASQPLRTEKNPEDKQFNRSVSFKVSLLDLQQRRERR